LLRGLLKSKDVNAMIELRGLRIGERVTMRYPNGILQEAFLIRNDEGMLSLQLGGFVHNCVGPIIDIFLNGSGKWRLGPQ
jgi:hypothetical protein